MWVSMFNMRIAFPLAFFKHTAAFMSIRNIFNKNYFYCSLFNKVMHIIDIQTICVPMQKVIFNY